MAPVSMSLVFVSYRRVDSSGFAGRIYDRLVDEFGRTHVFMDIDGQIPRGADFPAELNTLCGGDCAVSVSVANG
jgi:hypothetical protein